MVARNPGARASTIYDVARVAGVSHQTVSRLLRGFEGIRPETRRRVEAAIVELDYRPNLTARTLATSQSHRIGALTTELVEVGPSLIIDGASNAARDAGYLLDIVRLDPSDAAAAEGAIRLLGQHDLAGIIGVASTFGLVAAFREADFRVPIHIESEPDERITPGAGDSARGANWVGVRLAVEHLLALGHRRFMHVGGPPQWLSARNRAAAYEGGLAAHAVRSVGTIEGDWSAASGHAAGLRIPGDGSVTAVVAANDQIAFGVIRALGDRGLRVPEDISVVGFDDVPEAGFVRPSLTTVAVDLRQQGSLAVRRLIAEIEGRADPVPVPLVGPHLRIRESSGPPRR